MASRIDTRQHVVSMNLAYSESSISASIVFIDSESLSSSVVSTGNAVDRRLLHPALAENSTSPSSTRSS